MAKAGETEMASTTELGATGRGRTLATPGRVLGLVALLLAISAIAVVGVTRPGPRSGARPQEAAQQVVVGAAAAGTSPEPVAQTSLGRWWQAWGNQLFTTVSGMVSDVRGAGTPAGPAWKQAMESVCRVALPLAGQTRSMIIPPDEVSQDEWASALGALSVVEQVDCVSPPSAAIGHQAALELNEAHYYLQLESVAAQ